MVDPEADKFGITDVFLDNIFSAVPQLDGDSPGDRSAQAALLALDVLGQPLLPDGGESLLVYSCEPCRPQLSASPTIF